jgi:hypothetical protein
MLSADNEPTRRHNVFPVPVGLSMMAFWEELIVCCIDRTNSDCSM